MPLFIDKMQILSLSKHLPPQVLQPQFLPLQPIQPLQFCDKIKILGEIFILTALGVSLVSFVGLNLLSEFGLINSKLPILNWIVIDNVNLSFEYTNKNLSKGFENYTLKIDNNGEQYDNIYMEYQEVNHQSEIDLGNTLEIQPPHTQQDL